MHLINAKFVTNITRD
ncbi:hypothetical protein PIIN_11604 [Serendipita indica DSM 11827]|uniref:Uncharacterized protein n=1 Tax=Serendipita indica (strain DSM 11827) TaxID=1109443 RepID=G4U234_SERID|nr:hypothetical protein PIIN_11604 [Serendipita indica DSM 11827]